MTAKAPQTLPSGWPRLHRLGEATLIAEFAPSLSEAANRAALAFCADVEAAGWAGLEECSVTLKSAVIAFDPETLPHAEIEARLTERMGARDWASEPLPSGRYLWRIPASFTGDDAPQLGEAADLAGATEAALIDDIAETRLRVLTVGFAPGTPYLGTLPARWNIPRQTGLTPQVPRGALGAAVCQIVLFSVPAQTGWRQIGRSAFAAFLPEADAPFALRVGDEVAFDPVSPDRLARWEERAAEGELAAIREALP